MSTKKFTVVESRWLRGMKNGDGVSQCSQLLNFSGHQCCMGFLAEACGVPHDRRYAAAYFSSTRLEPYYSQLPEALRPVGDDRKNPQLARMIYSTNDDTSITDDERKTRLTALFAEAGVEVEFVP